MIGQIDNLSAILTMACYSSTQGRHSAAIPRSVLTGSCMVGFVESLREVAEVADAHLCRYLFYTQERCLQELLCPRHSKVPHIRHEGSPSFFLHQLPDPGGRKSNRLGEIRYAEGSMQVFLDRDEERANSPLHVDYARLAV